MIPICIQAIENEDDRAFMAQLFLDYNRGMFSEIYQILQDQWVTEDVLQDSIKGLIDHIPQLRRMNIRARTSYIMTTCRHNAISEDKKRRRTLLVPDSPSQEQTQDPAEQVLVSVTMEALHQVWPRLDQRTRQLLESKYILKMSDADIAAALNVKTDSVRMLLTRARNEARKAMQRELGET